MKDLLRIYKNDATAARAIVSLLDSYASDPAVPADCRRSLAEWAEENLYRPSLHLRQVHTNPGTLMCKGAI